MHLASLANEFARDRAALLEALAREPSGGAWCEAQTSLADDFLRRIFHAAAGAHSDSVALVAVGGYGRRELAPYSDVDLLVIPAHDGDPSLDSTVRTLHRELHTALSGEAKMAVSYAFFLVNDAPALDPKTRTAMLDARLVAGSNEAFQAFRTAFREHLPIGEFLLEKIRERAQALSKWNDTPLAVELHLKEGAGGLRSLHAANWIRTVIGLEPLRPTRAYEQMLMVRNLLHLTAGTNFDRHTRPRQAEVAELLGLPLAQHVRQTAESALELHAAYEQALGLLHSEAFSVGRGVSSRHGKLYIDAGTTLSDAALGVAVGVQLGLSVGPKPEDIAAEVDGPVAMYAIGTGEATVRALDRSGLLESLLPEVTRCRTLMPEDAVHEFSVFEHTLRTVRNIEQFPEDGFYGRLRDGLSSSGALYLGALLHDVGKAESGSHAETGARMAREVGRRWKLSQGAIESVEWLVREHLTLARFIGMRDIADPKTAQELAKSVGDRERLDMLAVLTCADVMAVAEHAWTPAQDAFLKELHGRTSALFEMEATLPEEPSAYRRRLLRMLKDHPVHETEVAAFLDVLPAQYAISTAPDLVPVHMELVRKATHGEACVIWDHDRDRNLSEVTVCAPDAPGLLSRILGVLYAFDLSVHALRANTTAFREENQVALDTVQVSFGRHLAPQATCSLVTSALVEVIEGKTSLDGLLRMHGKDPERKQEHFTFNFIEGTPGILEVQAPRGRGMAYRIAKMVFAQGWDIASARFGQWAGRGAAAFYLLGPGGQELNRAQVESALIAK